MDQQDNFIQMLAQGQLLREAHIDVCEKKYPNLWKPLCMNFNFMVQKYRLLSQPELQQAMYLNFESYTKFLRQFQSSLEEAIDHVQQMKLQFEAEMEKVVVELPYTQSIFEKIVDIRQKDEITDEDFEWLKENFQCYQNQSQKELDKAIFDVYQAQYQVSQRIKTSNTDIIANIKNNLQTAIQNLNLESVLTTLSSQVERYTEQFEQQELLVLPQPEVNIPSEEQSVVRREKALIIEDLIKERDRLHNLMNQHILNNSQGKPHAKVEGGGSFGYCWTGGYGWRGLHFEYLGLSQRCPECIQLNASMHDTAKQAYELGHREKTGWWVTVWFLYPK